jgi:hypothetical protein
LINSFYKSSDGKGRVVSYDVFKETVVLKFDNDKYEKFTLAQLKNFEYIPPAESEECEDDAEMDIEANELESMK